MKQFYCKCDPSSNYKWPNLLQKPSVIQLIKRGPNSIEALQTWPHVDPKTSIMTSQPSLLASIPKMSQEMCKWFTIMTSTILICISKIAAEILTDPLPRVTTIPCPQCGISWRLSQLHSKIKISSYNKRSGNI